MPLAAVNPVKSLLGLLPWIGRGGSGSDIEDKIQQAIFKFKELEGRVVEIRVRFEKRIEELMSKVFWAVKRGEMKRAEIYAQEVVHLKKLLTLVKTTERILTLAIERTKTARDVKELTEILLTFGAALDEVRSQMQGLYPGLALAFEEINKNIKLLILETAPPANITDIDTSSIAQEAVKILEEAKKHAEADVEKIASDEVLKRLIGFEEGEKTPQVKTAKKNSLRTPAAASSPAASQASKMQPSGRAAERARSMPAVQMAGLPWTEQRQVRRMSPEELEKKLLDYIVEHGGFLDVNDFVQRYRVSREEVFAALNRLRAKGLIRIA